MQYGQLISVGITTLASSRLLATNRYPKTGVGIFNDERRVTVIGVLITWLCCSFDLVKWNSKLIASALTFLTVLTNVIYDMPS
jgi:hypothetical protein